MKVLLIKPPVTVIVPAVGQWSLRRLFSLNMVPIGMPIGLLYIDAYLVQNGIESQLLDCFATVAMKDFEKTLPAGPTTIGMSDREIQEYATAINPDIVGISNLFWLHQADVFRIVRLLKNVLNRAFVVVGGPDVSAQAQSYLRGCEQIDAAVIGEGELTMMELARSLAAKSDLSRVAGLLYRSRGQVHLTPARPYIDNIDILPYPRYEKIPIVNYFAIQKRVFVPRVGLSSRRNIASFVTSRGCPHRCCFCVVHQSMGRRVRYHSAKYVLGHLKLLVGVHHADFICFEDDNLIANRRNFTEILSGVIDEGLRFNWNTPNGVRADRLDPELCGMMKKAGCTQCYVAIESGNQEFLTEKIGKALDLRQAEYGIKSLHQQGISTFAFYLIGFPDETRTQIHRTIQYALRLYWQYQVTPMLGRVYPTPGSALGEDCRERNLLVYSKRLNREVIQTSRFDEDYLNHCLEKFHFRLSLMLGFRESQRIVDTLITSLQPEVALRFSVCVWRLVCRNRLTLSNLRRSFRKIRIAAARNST